MNKKKAAHFTVLMLSVCLMNSPAFAVCHFKSANAILCADGKNAAAAYQAFGFDIARTNESYNRQLMQESGCGRPYGDAFATVDIKEINQGKVATAAGWVEVVTVEVNHHDLGAVARAYVEGVCEKPAPAVLPIPPENGGNP
jgi:hypothetical protein